MQEEIENRTVTLIISAVKLTARELKAGMDKYLSEKKSKAMEKAGNSEWSTGFIACPAFHQKTRPLPA